MAHLEVKPKSGTPWWLWLLLAIVIIAILLFLLKGCNSKKNVVTTDSTTTTTDSSSAKPAVAVTTPDFNGVDFNSPKSSDPDVTDKDISVSGNDKYTIYTLGENVLFATDQSTVQGSADAKLKQVISSLNKRFKGATIGVFGNTDSTGTTGHNKQLGADRAAAVKAWLVSNGGLDSTKVSVHSLGETKPVASNATASGRRQNRNVEIVAFPDNSGHKQ
jgi:outer membrane protein OmpA-like peptidoglycan-associated protein